MPHTDDPFAATVHTAHEWLRAVAAGLDTDDLAFAYRALRAWMHVVRDRIGMANSAHLTAQLPELLRGVYYEGWVPSHVPVHHGHAEFIEQFARAAGIGRHEVPQVAGAITAVLSDRFSPGQLNRVFAVLPAHLYDILCRAGVDASALSSGHRTRQRAVADQSMLLRDRVRALGDAVAALARGLEQLPIDTGDTNRMASAAQEAHRILLAEGLVSTARQH
ncbi:DUF2267 domain-containing protein [Nocardia xishanensis]|uniref:DUF2267 domain-containing protein n=1 Tax=Nocardia xishanensis TaxID=238964 RepID=UPI0008323C10|nr:DUF2267 domain-containing protein [Nocardia xishanensis]